MSGTFPSTDGFQTIEFQSNVRNRISSSVSNITQRVKVGGQYWSFKLQSPPMERASFMADYSFLISQDGRYGTFTIVPPVISNTTGTMTGILTVADVEMTNPTASTAAGSTQIAVQDDSTVGTLKKGDLIKFSNHNKVYMVVDDLNLNGSSTLGFLNFYPALTTSVDGGTTTITYNNVPFTVFLDEDEISFSVDQSNLYRYELKISEEL
jgi:hypothetical protein